MRSPAPPPSGRAGRSSDALAATYAWFEANSGWAPPDPDTVADWEAEGIARAPDECWVGPDGRCRHGLVSWDAVLADLARLDACGDP